MMKTIITALLLALLVGCATLNNNSLFNAILEKNTAKVEYILANKSVELDPPQQPYQVNKPLAYAAAYGNLEIVKLLVAKGADLNGMVAYGDVPLIKAMEHDNREVIKYLIIKGANVNWPNAFGNTPFTALCMGDDIELVQLALKHGGEVNKPYRTRVKSDWKTNYTALQAAVAYGQTDVVKLLLANGGNPNTKTPDGKTCLELALEKKHEAIVALLK